MANITECEISNNAAREKKALGAGFALCNVFMLALIAAAVKYLGESYSVFQISFARNVFSLFIVIPAVLYMGGRRALKTERPKLHLVRGVIGATAMLFLFSSYKLLPLADATAFGFTVPLFLAILSGPLLAEKVGRDRWIAVAVGFAGALVMARPSGEVTMLGIGVAVTGAFLVSLVMVLLRRMNNTEEPVAIIFYFTIFATLFTAIPAAMVWETPDAQGWGLLVLLGVMGGINQLLLTMAYRYAPAVLVGTFGYTKIIWASALGFMIWGHIPEFHVIMGAGIVIASGIFMLFSETGKLRRLRRTVPPCAP